MREEKQRLRDYCYPGRLEVCKMFPEKFYHSGNNYLWNREHRHVIEDFLLSSPLGEALKAYQKSVSTQAFNEILGESMNMIVKLCMHQISHPQQYGHSDIIGSILKGLSYSRALFVRRYHGILNHGKKDMSAMLAIEAPRVHNKKYSFTKKSMLFFAKRYSELFGNRAIHKLSRKS